VDIFWAVFWFFALGLGLGLILSFAGRIFAAEPDERIEMINEILPSVNCGGCGYTGCRAIAEAIVKGEAKGSGCPVAGKEVWSKIADIMDDHPVVETVRYRAQVMCSGTNDFAKLKYKYDGIPDCIAATRLAGGDKACLNGCLGLGTCIANCKFDAIKIINGVAAVDYEKCTACGACASACPKIESLSRVRLARSSWSAPITSEWRSQRSLTVFETRLTLAASRASTCATSPISST